MKREAAPLKLVKLTKQHRMSDATFDAMMRMLAEQRKGIVAHDDWLGAYPDAVEDNQLTAAAAPVPDCLTCGACCAYLQQVPVLLTDPTPRWFTWQVWEAGDRAGPKLHWLRREPEDGGCVALEGDIGEQVCCTIYPLRPRSCRAFEAGSDRCHAVRRMYGLERPWSELEHRAQAHRLGQPELETEETELEALEERDLSDGGERQKFLQELVCYNQTKFHDILAEVQRLSELLDERGLTQEKVKAERILRAIQKDLASVAKAEREMMNVTAPPIDEWEDSDQRLLAIGQASQSALERASKRLADLGTIVFEALNLRVAIR